MPQATFKQRSAAPAPAAEPAEAIQAGISAIAQATNQVRLHEHLLEQAGVRLDRAGAHLLAKLHLGAGQPLRVTDLAERLGVDTPTVTRKIQQLERLGFVTRSEDPDDRRSHRITLTASGRRTLERLTAARRAWLDELLEGWSREDLERFSRLLTRFADRLRSNLEDLHG